MHRHNPGPRSAAKREPIVETAVDAFAEHGYQGTRVEDVAAELDLLGLPALREQGGPVPRRVQPSGPDAPRLARRPYDVKAGGFWSVLVYRLERTEHLVQENWAPYRVTLIGTYGTDLALRTEINRYMVSQDPYGTLEFVEYGIARGDLRADLDVEMAASMLDWMAGGFQDALVSKGLDPGLLHRHPNPRERRALRIEQFVDLLRRSLGTTRDPMDRAQDAGSRRIADRASAGVTSGLR